MKLLWLLLCAALAAQASAVRMTVLTRLNQVMPEAVQRFEKRFGAGRVELRYGDFESPPPDWDQSDVIFTYLMPNETAVRLAPQFRAAIARGARVIAHWPEPAQRQWGLKQDARTLQTAIEYWSYGGAENVARCIAFLAGIAQEPPENTVTVGIYHPDRPHPFVSLEDYLTWHRTLRRVPADAPRVAVLFYHTSLKSADTAHIAALIAAIEKGGMTPVAVFGWPPPVAEPLLVRNGQPAVDAALALNLGFAKPDDTAFLSRLNVHVIDLMTTRQSLAEWKASPHGVRTDQLAIQVAAPERAGGTDPITFAATERSSDGKSAISVPIPERVDMAVRRVARWIALRRKPNLEKRLAILYYNSPPGKGNIGASYLDVPGALAALLERLQREGYQTGGDIPNAAGLLAALERAGRNIEEWAPGELQAIVNQHQAVLISMKQYRRWLAGTPREFQDALERNWGAPEQSTLMTIRSRDNEPYFVFPGLRFGNIVLAPQPLRSAFRLAGKTLHDTTIPPPHSYVAAYLYLRRAFNADAITHLGRHGTLEFLPGKDVGLAGWDPAEVLMDDLPAPYYFIIDGGGESTTARRRGQSTMLGHLTPMLVSGGVQDEFRDLREALRQINSVRDTSPGLLEQYRSVARREIRRHKLDGQLGFDLDHAAWNEIEEKVEAFLEDSESGPIPMGIHRLEQLPREEIQIESLGEFLKSGLRADELRDVGSAPAEWADGIFQAHDVALNPAWPASLRDRVSTQLAAGRQWLADLRRSPAMELDNYVRVLRGEYLESGSTGDPLRTPSALPSGRNLHDFDPALIPTPAACELGRKLGDQVLERHRQATGKLPEKVSMVLWYGETIRHQGAMECQALYLMGVQPKWNSRGIVDGLRLVPEAELKRPRIDVVVTIAGIYRDGFPDKALLLDRASRMVQQAGENALSRNTRRNMEALLDSGLTRAQAERAAAARVFGPAPGDYGGGISNLIKQSRDAGDPALIAEAYLKHNNFAYGAAGWGENLPKALETQLQGNQVVIHSRATNLYGVTDNDDFFDFAGGLNLASKTVNGGAAPQFYVANLRKMGRESLQEFQSFFAAEMNSRFWNPKWIREMKNSGYGGAREIADHLENVYGWQATTPEQVDGSIWDKTYQVYVEDRYSLGLKEFFERQNPHARQYMLARMLEVDRQGSHTFTLEQRAEMVRQYVRSVAHHGVGCSANTCGNRQLQQSILLDGGRTAELTPAELRQFRAVLDQAFRQSPTATAPTVSGTGGGSGNGGRTSGRKPFRIFHATAPPFVDGDTLIPIGAALFFGFWAASSLLGALEAAWLRRKGGDVVVLRVNAGEDFSHGQ